MRLPLSCEIWNLILTTAFEPSLSYFKIPFCLNFMYGKGFHFTLFTLSATMLVRITSPHSVTA